MGFILKVSSNPNSSMILSSSILPPGQVGVVVCVVSFGTAQGWDLGFSTALPCMGLEHRPEGVDEYSLHGSDWKLLLFPTATVRGAMGLKMNWGHV